MKTNIRKMIIDNVDDEKAARELILEMQLIESRVSEREWALEDRVLELEAQAVKQ